MRTLTLAALFVFLGPVPDQENHNAFVETVGNVEGVRSVIPEFTAPINYEISLDPEYFETDRKTLNKAGLELARRIDVFAVEYTRTGLITFKASDQ